MANHKRGKSRRKVICVMCTPFRNGNSYLRRIEQAARADEKQQRKEMGE